MNILRHYLLTILLATIVCPANAEKAKTSLSQDSTYVKLYKEYFELYDKTGRKSEAQFNEVSNKLKDFFLQREDIDGYYQVRLNEVFFENNHKRSFSAVQKANAMLDDMKERDINRYNIVYQALGSVYQARGNYRMALKYFTDAHDNTEPEDSFARMNIYFRLANLQMFYQPEHAYEWIEKANILSASHASYHQVYYILKAIIEYSLNKREAFQQTYREYTANRERNKNLDDNGLYTMNVLNNAFNGKYQAALDQLENPSSDLSDLERMSLRCLVQQRQNRYDKALATQLQAAYVIDSLNSDMLFENLNYVNAEVGVAKMEAKAAQQKLLWLSIIIALTLIIIAFLIFWILYRRRARRLLIRKNKQLEAALDMANESDKMKTSFLKNITHEIRTPLNSISGFTQLLNNPDFELDNEEKAKLTKDINRSVRNITQIVDELLQVSQSESNKLYTQKASINCNKMLRDILKNHSKFGIKMQFTTSLGTNFTINTNESGLRQIVNHLLENALKFTESGSVTLHSDFDAEKRQVSISVTDTGSGIPEDQQEHIFDHFYKVDQFKQGIGLGLSINKMIAKKLGGDLVLDKNYKDGARFVLTLPIE